MKPLKKFLLALLLLVPLFVGGGSSEAEEPEHPSQVMLSWTEWTQLRTAWAAQTEDLSQLEVKLNQLQKNSTGQTQDLLELQEQLKSSREQLQKAKESLTNAQTSLSDAKKELEQSRASLQELKKKIEAMEKTESRMKRQRNIYAVVAVTAVGAAIARG